MFFLFSRGFPLCCDWLFNHALVHSPPRRDRRPDGSCTPNSPRRSMDTLRWAPCAPRSFASQENDVTSTLPMVLRPSIGSCRFGSQTSLTLSRRPSWLKNAPWLRGNERTRNERAPHGHIKGGALHQERLIRSLHPNTLLHDEKNVHRRYSCMENEKKQR